MPTNSQTENTGRTCPWCWKRFRTVHDRQAHQDRENHPPEVFTDG